MLDRIYSRHGVRESLRARRRSFQALYIAEGVEDAPILRDIRQLAAEAKAAQEERAAKEQQEAAKLKDPLHPTNVHRRLWKELMRLLQQASDEQLGKKDGEAGGLLPAHARSLRIAEIKMELEL